MTVNAQRKNMSFNIRFDNPADGEDRWELRKEELCDLIIRQKPDFLGLQESLPTQVEFIQGKLKGYMSIGFGRDGEGTTSESTPLFYRSERFELLKKEVFWMSETPSVPSKGWDAALNRITTYGVFRDRQSKDTIHVFNTHYDHKGEKARENSSHLIIAKIKEWNLTDKKVVLMGDFNSRPGDEPIQILLSSFNDAFVSSNSKSLGPEGTFNSFDPQMVPDQRIDYIFTLNLHVLSFETIADKRKNGRWISDHLPVMAQVAE